MSLQDQAGRPVHFPADPGKFQFDKEVSAVFPDMAKRAIPNFYEAHEAHAKMLEMWMRPGVRILDIGASRGAFIQALLDYHPSLNSLSYGANIVATDVSPDMCNYLRTEFPNIRVRNESLLDMPDEQYDVVCLHYVLQFIPRELHNLAIHKALRMVRPGGVFIYGHKAAHSGLVGELMHDRYIDFRIRNGYSKEEIQAKTAALKGSMFPVEDMYIKNVLHSACSVVEQTFKFMMFSTYFAVK